jgi:hypothetical protein
MSATGNETKQGVTALRNIKEAVGLTQKTSDDNFMQLERNIHTLDSLPDDMKKSLAQYASALTAFFASSKTVNDHFVRYYKDDPSYPMTSVVATSEEGLRVLLGVKMVLLDKLIQEKIMPLVSDFAAQLGDKHRIMKEREANRIKFDHYRTKIVKLRAEKEEAIRKGKKVDLVRLERNEGKFSEAEKEFNGINEMALRNLQEFWDNRHRILDALFSEWFKLESFFLAATVEDLSSLRPLVINAMKASVQNAAARSGVVVTDFTGPPPVLRSNNAPKSGNSSSSANAGPVIPPGVPPGWEPEPPPLPKAVAKANPLPITNPFDAFDDASPRALPPHPLSRPNDKPANSTPKAQTAKPSNPFDFQTPPPVKMPEAKSGLENRY